MRGRDEMEGQPYRARMRAAFKSMEPNGMRRHRLVYDQLVRAKTMGTSVALSMTISQTSTAT